MAEKKSVKSNEDSSKRMRIKEEEERSGGKWFGARCRDRMGRKKKTSGLERSKQGRQLRTIRWRRALGRGVRESDDQ